MYPEMDTPFEKDNATTADRISEEVNNNNMRNIKKRK
jgi:hypothetical protein